MMPKACGYVVSDRIPSTCSGFAELPMMTGSASPRRKFNWRAALLLKKMPFA